MADILSFINGSLNFFGLWPYHIRMGSPSDEAKFQHCGKTEHPSGQIIKGSQATHGDVFLIGKTGIDLGLSTGLGTKLSVSVLQEICTRKWCEPS